MLKYIITFSILTIALCLNAQQFEQKIDSIGDVTLNKSGTNGAYISIQKGNSVIYSSGFGYRDSKTKSVFTDSTVFPISSNTKAFNSILIAQLVEQNQLDFEEPLINYLPDLKFKNDFITQEINLIDLLTHKFGFPRYDFTYYMLNEEKMKNPNEAVFKKLRYLETTSSFRTKFQYGNNQYIIAAYLIEKLTGNKWEDELASNLLSPLKMRDTHCSLNKYKASLNKSVGYQSKYEVDIQIAAPLYAVSGMGNMFSTIRDLEKWTSFLLNGDDTILSNQLLKKTQTSHFNIGYEEPFNGFSNMEYGLGWFIFDYFGHKVVLHHGDNVGHKSMVVLLPDDNISWSIIANEGMVPYGFPFIMSFSILDLILEHQPNDWNTKLHVEWPPSFLYCNLELLNKFEIDIQPNNYIGQYTNAEFGTIKLFIDKGRLHLATSGYTDELIFWENNKFKSISEEFHEEYYYHFQRDENGQIISLTTNLIEPSVADSKFFKQN